MNTKDKLQELINKSPLEDEDKKLFISFLDDLSKEELENMHESFEQNGDMLQYFWENTKAKMLVIAIINTNDEMPQEQKVELINDIIAMDEDAFKLFLESLDAVTSSDDPQKELESLIDKQKQVHQKFMTQTRDFIEQLKKEHVDLQQDQDQDDYKDVLNKIKGL